MNLERLKQLLTSGAITQEEFDQMAVDFQEETREEEGDTGEEESDTAEEAENKDNPALEKSNCSGSAKSSR